MPSKVSPIGIGTQGALSLILEDAPPLVIDLSVYELGTSPSSISRWGMEVQGSVQGQAFYDRGRCGVGKRGEYPLQLGSRLLGRRQE